MKLDYIKPVNNVEHLVKYTRRSSSKIINGELNVTLIFAPKN